MKSEAILRHYGVDVSTPTAFAYACDRCSVGGVTHDDPPVCWFCEKGDRVRSTTPDAGMTKATQVAYWSP
jgi:hypothetical protein